VPDGLSIRELLEARAGGEHDLHAQTINPQFVRMLRTIGFDKRWRRGQGAYLWDDEDNRYLDLLGGFGMFSVGRNHPIVRAALEEALELDLPLRPALGVVELPPLLAEKLLALAPPGIERCLFTSSGTESVETAIKFARAATARPRVVHCRDAFHGFTLGSLSASGERIFRERFGPLLPGFAEVPFGDLEALERELAQEDVALFLTEPIQGHGMHMPPPGYLEAAQALCRRYGTLFCVDEVQAGLGRTGKMLALEHWGLEPDLVTVAKALSGGYVPVGACLMRASVHDKVHDSLERSLLHGSTFAPNELAMVAGLATLHVYEQERLVERSARLGDLLLERTRALVESTEVVRDVRGLGLMWGIEFGEPESRRRTWRLVEGAQQGLFSQLVVGPLFHEHRILTQVAGHRINVIRILPPLVLSEDDVESFASALETVVRRAERMPRALVGFALRAAKASLARA
jgi:ornithine--oxo-acid transaminase